MKTLTDNHFLQIAKYIRTKYPTYKSFQYVLSEDTRKIVKLTSIETGDSVMIEFEVNQKTGRLKKREI